MLRDVSSDKTNWYVLKDYNYVIYNKFYNAYYNTINHYLTYYNTKAKQWMMWDGRTNVPYKKEIFFCKGPVLLGVCSQAPGREGIQPENDTFYDFHDAFRSDSPIRILGVGGYTIIGIGSEDDLEYIDIIKEGYDGNIDFPFRVYIS